MDRKDEVLLRMYIRMQTEYYVNKHTMYPGLAWKADFFTLEEFRENPTKYLSTKYRTPKALGSITSANSVATCTITMSLHSTFCLHRGVPYNQKKYVL